MRLKNSDKTMQDVNSGNIQRLEAMISEARKISIVTHQKPDGDAMGSSIALYHFLRMYGKTASASSSTTDSRAIWTS